MEIEFLGTGTSTGVPEVGCNCKVCTSNNIKDRRLRASVFIATNNKRLLIDCGPDFRQQVLNNNFAPIDGVLITHEHYDHVGGIDDLRTFNKFGDIDIYSNEIAIVALKSRIPYCFAPNLYPGVPSLHAHIVDADTPFEVAGIAVQAINIMHFNLPIFGYRIHNFAYLTDVKSIEKEELEKLKNLDVLVLDALRQHKEHVSHITLQEALTIIDYLKPKKSYLTHMSHQMGLHDEIEKTLPSHVHLAYDGLKLTLE